VEEETADEVAGEETVAQAVIANVVAELTCNPECQVIEPQEGS
jgi:hypothetical protein